MLWGGALHIWTVWGIFRSVMKVLLLIVSVSVCAATSEMFNCTGVLHYSDFIPFSWIYNSSNDTYSASKNLTLFVELCNETETNVSVENLYDREDLCFDFGNISIRNTSKAAEISYCFQRTFIAARFTYTVDGRYVSSMVSAIRLPMLFIEKLLHEDVLMCTQPAGDLGTVYMMKNDTLVKNCSIGEECKIKIKTGSDDINLYRCVLKLSGCAFIFTLDTLSTFSGHNGRYPDHPLAAMPIDDAMIDDTSINWLVVAILISGVIFLFGYLVYRM
ncbi:b148.2 [miniopterid betaherpesvirus 1]|uniref:B148.2 n=1 Tax=miniopterid betaherpesvirus 1 TaxID=3070189 RepID=I3VQD3_9BETA|nr:b148.2 [miniopterid betaherpesvirus 1]AFK83977.1 b148.2 [miniopterid betaherpesvirus 1]